MAVQILYEQFGNMHDPVYCCSVQSWSRDIHYHGTALLVLEYPSETIGQKL